MLRHELLLITTCDYIAAILNFPLPVTFSLVPLIELLSSNNTWEVVGILLLSIVEPEIHLEGNFTAPLTIVKSKKTCAL